MPESQAKIDRCYAAFYNVYYPFMTKSLGRQPTVKEWADFVWTVRCLNPRSLGYDAPPPSVVARLKELDKAFDEKLLKSNPPAQQ